MNTKWYYFTANGHLSAAGSPPPASRSFLQATAWLQPSQLDRMHRSFQAWGAAFLSPGLVTPERIWIDGEDTVAFRFQNGEHPSPQSTVGAHAGLAAWLVLLDKYVDTEDVLTTASAVWSTTDLASALAFMNAALLPATLLALPPDNWEHIARALAKRVASRPAIRTDRAA